MNRLVTIVVIWAASAASHAQLVYVDDFVGNALDPRWSLISECAACEYNVNYGMMNITRIPQVQPCGDTRVRMVDYFPSLPNDFDMSVVVDWTAGIPQSIGMAIQSNGGPYYGAMTYYGSAGSAGFIRGGLYAEFPSVFEIVAPPQGLHEFRITRVGNVHSAYLDGSLVHQVAGPSFSLLGAISMEVAFQSSPSVQYSADLHIDRVVVAAPSPGACGISLVALALGARRRSR